LPDFCTSFESVRSHLDVFVAGKIFAAHSMGDENIPGDHIKSNAYRQMPLSTQLVFVGRYL
jgi:hypothetical protein